jgi:hypothetical protein
MQFSGFLKKPENFLYHNKKYPLDSSHTGSVYDEAINYPENHNWLDVNQGFFILV